MDNKCYQLILEEIYQNIEYYKNKIAVCSNPSQVMYYEGILENERMSLNYWKNYNHFLNPTPKKLNSLEHSVQINKQESKVFTVEELAEFNGSNGKPAYVAVNGIVYDVSLETRWGGGTHFSLYAGKDLSTQFNVCHGGNLVTLANLPKVGILKE